MRRSCARSGARDRTAGRGSAFRIPNSELQVRPGILDSTPDEPEEGPSESAEAVIIYGIRRIRGEEARF